MFVQSCTILSAPRMSQPDHHQDTRTLSPSTLRLWGSALSLLQNQLRKFSWFGVTMLRPPGRTASPLGIFLLLFLLFLPFPLLLPPVLKF